MPTKDNAAFADALRSAIGASGLSLDQLRRELQRRGVKVSAASLSYWQSGRSRPERGTSLAAIGTLEECLGLSRGQLGSLLPVSGLGRVGVTPLAHDLADRPSRTAWSQRHAVEAAAAIGLDYSTLARSSTHDRLQVGADRCRHEHQVRLVMSATRHQVSRYPVWVPGEGGTAVEITPVLNCAVGRMTPVPEHGGTSVEMVLPRTLRRDETILVEHRETYHPPQDRCDHVWRFVHRPFRELLFVVQFSEGVLPRAVWATTILNGRQTDTEVAVRHTIQALFSEGGAGQYGLRWEWGDEA